MSHCNLSIVIDLVFAKYGGSARNPKFFSAGRPIFSEDAPKWAVSAPPQKPDPESGLQFTCSQTEATRTSFQSLPSLKVSTRWIELV